MPPTNFHEKALLVKADVAAPFVVERYGPVSFAMLPFALLVSPLFDDSVHYEILLFGLPRRCNLRIGLFCPSQRGWTKFGLRSRLLLDPKRSDTQRSRASRSRRAAS